MSDDLKKRLAALKKRNGEPLPFLVLDGGKAKTMDADELVDYIFGEEDEEGPDDAA